MYMLMHVISTFDPSLRDVDPGVKRKPKIFCHVLIQQSQGTFQASVMFDITVVLVYIHHFKY